MNNDLNFQNINNTPKRICPFCNRELNVGELSCPDCYYDHKRRTYKTIALTFFIIYFLIFIFIVKIGNGLSDLGSNLSGGSKNDAPFYAVFPSAFVFSCIPYFVSLFFSIKSKSHVLIFINAVFGLINILLMIISSL